MNEEDRTNVQGGGIAFTNFPVNMPSIIKVIGVGGGGGNAVNHMYNEGIHDVTYLVCNTDNKALSDSPVPNKLQLGKDGLGAGNRPERAKAAALDSLDAIKERLQDGTRMVFITAGMGGGTGTGAAPIIAQCAKDMGILTVGIVTIPFRFEGIKKIDQALSGVEELSKHVDAILVISNERLREIYPELTVINAFAKADNTLLVAARSIADIITMHGIMNLDFQDVTTVLKDGGVAVMSTGFAEGENRVTKAIEAALHSPLLNNNNIFNSQKVIININFPQEGEDNQMKMGEMDEIHEFMGRFRKDVETKLGLATDPTLEKQVKITFLATGFGLNVPGMDDVINEREKRDQEVEEDKSNLRDMYYGGGKGARKKVRIFIFSSEDMDSDEVISKVGAIPTYRRTREELNQIKKKTAAPAQTAAKPAETDTNRVEF
ncbi:MAG: cell division protein FtsZ [Prevotellaceae bacterium]|nr:cell division protein FtsZ [Prevotellaceae bacterium]